jgi:hypothetical protein
MLGLLAYPVRAHVLYALDVVDKLCIGDVALALNATRTSVGYGLGVAHGRSGEHSQERSGQGIVDAPVPVMNPGERQHRPVPLVHSSGRRSTRRLARMARDGS